MNTDCPSIPTLTDSDKSIGLAEALKQLNLKACKQTTVGGAVATLFPLGVGAVGGTTSVGCEQVLAISDSIAAMQNNITCILNSTTSNNVIDVSQSNTTTLKISNFSGPLTLTQRNFAGVKAVSRLLDDQKTQIATKLTSDMKLFFKNTLNSKQGYLSTAQGQKVVENFQKALDQNNITEQANSAVNSMSAMMVQNNVLTIEITNYSSFPNTVGGITNGGVNITQENVINYQASMITSTFLTNIFSTDEGATFVDQVRNGMIAESEGISSLVSALVSGLMVIVLLVLGGIVVFGGSAINNVTKYIIPLAFIGAVIVSVIFGLKKDVLIAVISGVVALFLGIFEYFSNTKQGSSTAGFSARRK